jgi:Ala-tRNA(Pro) deacylase
MEGRGSGKEVRMAMLQKLMDYLEENKVEYTHTAHPPAYTAREVASAEHVSERSVAKVVVFLSDAGYGMAVVPADSLVDLQEMRALLGFARVRLATEAEIGQLFPDCELGAMPPFGHFAGIPVFADSSLAGEDMIAFNAGTHRDVVHMHYRDFERLVKPARISFSRRAAA